MPLFAFLVVFMLADFYLLFRNTAVYQERMSVLDAISTWSKADIAAGRSWQWRYDAYEAITHWRMLFSLRPVESFFDGAPCCTAIGPTA